MTEPREDLFEKTGNAYLDTINIYRLTNPLNAENRGRARERDSRSSDDPFLALFHPISLPGDIDFANESRREWRNPSGEGESRNESLWDLWEAARERRGSGRSLDRRSHFGTRKGGDTRRLSGTAI